MTEKAERLWGWRQGAKKKPQIQNCGKRYRAVKIWWGHRMFAVFSLMTFAIPRNLGKPGILKGIPRNGKPLFSTKSGKYGMDYAGMIKPGWTKKYWVRTTCLKKFVCCNCLIWTQKQNNVATARQSNGGTFVSRGEWASVHHRDKSCSCKKTTGSRIDKWRIRNRRAKNTRKTSHFWGLPQKKIKTEKIPSWWEIK